MNSNNSHSYLENSGSGSFVSNLTALSPGTTYNVRAYATNEAGTAYGQVEIFETITENDIDNDGDVDDSDEYLHKRRKAIKKAMKEEQEARLSEDK